MDGIGFILSYLVGWTDVRLLVSGFWFRTAMCLWSVRYRLEDVSLGAGGGNKGYVCMYGRLYKE